jgi:hypothetical protein
LRNFSAGTQQKYVQAVADFARHYGASPERLGLDEIRNYQLYLIERQLAPETINGFVSAVKFLYVNTLEMPWGDEQFTRMKVPARLWRAAATGAHTPSCLQPATLGRYLQPIFAEKTAHRTEREPEDAGCRE